MNNTKPIKNALLVILFLAFSGYIILQHHSKTQEIEDATYKYRMKAIEVEANYIKKAREFLSQKPLLDKCQDIVNGW